MIIRCKGRAEVSPPPPFKCRVLWPSKIDAYTFYLKVNIDDDLEQYASKSQGAVGYTREKNGLIQKHV